MTYRQLAVALVVCVGACAELFHSGPTPAALAGAWVDVEHTTPDDSSIWLLAPSGNEHWLRVRVRRTNDGRVESDTSRRQSGMWYVSGGLGDTGRRALCFNPRPGRDGPSCLRFKLDTLPSGRRLTLLGFLGEQDATPRVLLEHR